MSYFFDLVMQYAVDELQGMAERKPSRAELDKYFANCGGPWTQFDNTTHWCGIFATYILRKAGVKAHWVMSKGIRDDSGGQHIQAINGNKGMSYGDVAVRKGASHHHFIVLRPAEKGQIYCVEGNYGGVGNPWLHHGYNWKNTVDAVECYYRVY